MLRRRLKSILRKLLASVAFLAGGAAFLYLHALLSIGAAFKAKILCSEVFVAGRDAASVCASDLGVDDLSSLNIYHWTLNPEKKSVTASFWGLVSREAVYREGLGCTLVYGSPLAEGAPQDPVAGRDLETARADAGIDPARLSSALDWAFSEPDPAKLRRTRALVVLHHGRVVAERYAPGFGPATRFVGWSMSKSVVQALVGILVKDGKLSLDQPAPLAEWQGDARRRITPDQLLTMSSGLQFDEDYNSRLSDVARMLFQAPDMAAFAIGKNLVVPPGLSFRYSSGATIILCKIIRQALGERENARFPRERLFRPLGMSSALLEQDAAGTWAGSSYVYASARDWARFGMLYLNDGVWEGRRILPEGWVRLARKPAEADESRSYGRHFWIRVPVEFTGERRIALPADAFHAVGYQGQFVSIVPSRDLVVVRLGLARYPHAWNQEELLDRILKAVAPGEARR